MINLYTVFFLLCNKKHRSIYLLLRALPHTFCQSVCLPPNHGKMYVLVRVRCRKPAFCIYFMVMVSCKTFLYVVQTADHETALLSAAHFGYTDVVAQLIAKGADVTIRNIRDESALDLAAQYGR